MVRTPTTPRTPMAAAAATTSSRRHRPAVRRHGQRRWLPLAASCHPAKFVRLINMLTLLSAALTLTAVVAAVDGCPAEVCICKWKGGKQTVECGGQQLPSIPEGMDPGTQVLNFSGNSLQVLQSERFLRMDLLNLQKIYLSRNQLIRIHEKAFRGLSNLVELDLSDNALQHVPSETFQDYSSLMRLSLNGNPIRELKTSAFRHLSFLTTLELSNCQIERIENEAFVGMDNLEWLRLDGNRIGFIQGAHILPKSLHGISLQSNRWTCDCRLLDVHGWLVNYNTPQSEEPKCVEPPRLKGQTIKALKKDELACLPEVSPASTYTEISEGRNVSIVCVVRAIPEPRVLWLFNGQVMSNDSLVDNLHMFYYIDESSGGTAGEEKRSEIFIYNVGAEDNGTFSCVGQNIAGTTFSNYTLRVIIKEPPVVNEVSFPRDYMNYIIASSTGAGVIFVVMLCTIVIKCQHTRKPAKRKKCGPASGVTSVAGNTVTASADGSLSDGGLVVKCSSLINGDGDSLNGGAGLHLGDGMTPTKLGKENGLLIGTQMKQNLLLYAPAQYQQQLHDASQQQQHLHQQHQQQQQQAAMDAINGQALQALNASLAASGTPPPSLLLGGGELGYCSPPASLRNHHYQEKNPDLVNDAESGQHKALKAAGAALDGDFDANSDCSGPCSIQGMPPPLPPSLATAAGAVSYDGCYQLTPQFSSLTLRPSASGGLQAAAAAAGVATSRFSAMTTLPRGMQLKTVMNGLGALAGPPPQHQVDVHLNPVCFLGQDGFAYDYSNAHLQQPAPPQPSSHHHLHLQPQLSLGSNAVAGPASLQAPQHQQQNFYRTLPHNRAHKQQQFAAAAAASPSMRYSLEAEFMQRAGTPPYDKYMPNVRFTAEGYPHSMPTTQQQQQQQQHHHQQQQQQMGQYPSPPEGYKTVSVGGESALAGGGMAMQQWPPCLPGYHAQQQQQQAGGHRYAPTIVGVLTTGGVAPPQAHHHSQPQHDSPAILTSTCQTQTPPNENTSNCVNSGGAGAGTPKGGGAVGTSKRCASSQADNSTIPECDESDEPASGPTSAEGDTPAVASTSSGSVGGGGAGGDGGGSAPNEDNSKLRHLNGPLADSPDEGYVGDSHEGSDV